MIIFKHCTERSRWIRGIAGLFILSTLVGCDQDGAKVYRIPKEEAPPAQSAPAVDSTPVEAPTPEATPPAPDTATPAVAPTPASPLKYVLPAGWKEKPPGDMRVVSLDAVGPNGVVDIGVIPLGIVGRDMELVNMWRSNVQLPPTNDPDAVKQFEPVTIGGGQGRLFGYVSDQAAPGKAKQRIFVATITRGTMSWFFKMAGDDAVVLSQKKNFIQFLKSVSFEENANAR